MNDTYGLNIREIFHFRYGICQMVYFSPARCWVGLNEKKQTLWAPDDGGNPNMGRVRRPTFVYREQLSYLEILNRHYKPDCEVISLRRDELTSA